MFLKTNIGKENVDQKVKTLYAPPDVGEEEYSLLLGEDVPPDG